MTEAFIARWEKSGAAERANYQPFLIGLCGVLGVDPPEPSLPDESRNTYVFEKTVRFPNRDGTLDIGRADLYKRGHFLMETKQGANEGASRPGHGIRSSGVWDQAMVRAKNQGERYVRALHPGEGRPPFLLVVDVGYSITMYWWHKAAVLARAGKIERFGFITTNSLRQTFNRRVLEEHLAAARPDIRNRLALVFAIPDHPWVENADGAAVGIAMTVGVRRKGREPVMGVLKTVIAESKFPTVVRESTPDENDVAVALDARTSGIHADLTIGADVAGAVALLANADISCPGVKLHGSGFIVTMLVCVAHDDAYVLGVLSSRIHVAWALAAGSWLGVGNDPVYVKSRCFETFPFPDATEAQRARIRDVAERLDAHRKRQLALHPTLTMTDLYNILALCVAGGSQAPLTAKQRAVHEQGLVTILRQLHDELEAAVAEAYGWGGEEGAAGFGVQGSGASLAQSRPMEQTSSSVSPSLSRALSGALSTSGGKDDVPCGSGSFGELRPTSGALDSDAILDRLVALNRVRAEEEARGTVRYLRPEYQAPSPGGRRAVAAADDESADATARIPPTEQSELALPADGVAPEDETQAWPKELASQIALVRDIIARSGWQPSDGVKALAKHFTGVRAPTLQRHVDALVALGQV